MKSDLLLVLWDSQDLALKHGKKDLVARIQAEMDILELEIWKDKT